MDKKVLIALGLSIGIIWFWQAFVMVPEQPKPDQPAQAQQADGAGPATAKPDAPGADAPKAEAGKAEAGKTEAGEPAKTRQPEAMSSVEIPGRIRAQLTSWGAAFQELVLLEPRFKEKLDGKDVQIDLVSAKAAPLPFSVTFPDAGFALPADADFQLVAQEGNERRYVASVGTTRIEKRYTFVPDGYQFRLDVTVENGGEKPLLATMRLSLSGHQDPKEQPSMFKPSVIQTTAICSGDDTERKPFEKLIKEPFELSGRVGMVAIDRKYFVLAAAMPIEDKAKCRLEATAAGRVDAFLFSAPVSIAASGKHTWSVTGFAGPKVVHELDEIKLADGKPSNLKKVMDYGFTEVFVRPMLWTLKTIYRGIHNWGLAIILLTMLLKAITWWPTAQSMKSAQQMAKLKPEMDKLKERFGDDKQRINQEMMALYQKHKINPLGGCLPLLIQMPIYIALYSMLGNSVELYRADFGLWIHDLTGPDPYFVLPLLTGGVMFLQQKLSPAPVDPQQQTMMTVMPLMFTGMSIFLPAGLTVYILTNTVLSFVQQKIIAPKTPAKASS